MIKKVLQIVLALTALVTVFGTGTATAAPTAGAVSPSYTTYCSLRWNDWTSDCMRTVAFLSRSRLVPGDTNFEWSFVSTGAPDTYTIHDRGTGSCVDILGDWVDAGVAMNHCDGSASQTWIMVMNHSAGPSGLEIFHPLRNGFSGLYMTFETVIDPHHDPGATPIVQRPFGDRASQYFARLGPA